MGKMENKMNDLISRQEALKTYQDIVCKGICCSDCRAVDRDGNCVVEDWLKALPSAQQWIPCSERLPEENEDVLVWYEYFRYGAYNCMYQTYGIGYYSIVNSKVIWGGDVSGYRARAIAWMPLPPPWKGVKG